MEGLHNFSLHPVQGNRKFSWTRTANRASSYYPKLWLINGDCFRRLQIQRWRKYLPLFILSFNTNILDFLGFGLLFRSPPSPPPPTIPPFPSLPLSLGFFRRFGTSSVSLSHSAHQFVLCLGFDFWGELGERERGGKGRGWGERGCERGGGDGGGRSCFFYVGVLFWGNGRGGGGEGERGRMGGLGGWESV